MAAITWDETGKRYLHTGTDHGVLYPMTAGGKYGTGVAWNGLTAVTDQPSGAEVTNLWADNIKYASLRSAEEYGLTIEAYTYPDEFAECDGSATPLSDVKGVHVGQQSRKAFGFSWRTMVENDTGTDEDDGYIIHIAWNCTASPSERAYATKNDSPDAVQFSWEVSTTPVSFTKAEYASLKPTASMEIDSRAFSGGNEAKLKAVLDKLYGTGVEGTPTLPSPEELLDLIKTAGGE